MATTPTLTQMFGTNASQTGTTFTVTKADLQQADEWLYTPDANDTPEELLFALLLKSRKGQDISSDARCVISLPTSSLTTRGGIQMKRTSFTVDFYSVESTIINVDAV